MTSLRRVFSTLDRTSSGMPSVGTRRRRGPSFRGRICHAGTVLRSATTVNFRRGRDARDPPLANRARRRATGYSGP